MKFPTKLTGPLIRPQKRQLGDDVHLEAYKPDSIAFADMQRKGIRESFDGCYSLKGSIRRLLFIEGTCQKGCRTALPLASEIPIPGETTTAARFVADNDPRLLADFRGAQLNAIEILVTSAAHSQARWGGFIDPAIRPADGEIQTMDLRQMA